MFDFILEDDGIVHRLKELKEYYKSKDNKDNEEEKKNRKAKKDSILKKVFKIYPGM